MHSRASGSSGASWPTTCITVVSLPSRSVCKTSPFPNWATKVGTSLNLPWPNLCNQVKGHHPSYCLCCLISKRIQGASKTFWRCVQPYIREIQKRPPSNLPILPPKMAQKKKDLNCYFLCNYSARGSKEPARLLDGVRGVPASHSHPAASLRPV